MAVLSPNSSSLAMPLANSIEWGVNVRVCSGVKSGYADRPAGARGVCANRRGHRARAAQTQRKRTVNRGAGRGIYVHRNRACRLGPARFVYRAQCTLTRGRSEDI